MRQDLIAQAVPDVDLEFVRTMEKIPDPPPGIYEEVVGLLPRFHGLFLRKRQAFAADDAAVLAAILDEETALLSRLSAPLNPTATAW
jgi:hypothetical protein